jgi:translation initiation factor 5A
MVLKIISATEIKSGTSVIIDGNPYTVKGIDISKTGKHGSSKCRIEAIGIMDDKKKIVVVPGHEKFSVPMIEKRKAQVLSMSDKVSAMDLESFETLELPCPEELKGQIGENSTIEYWNVEGERIIKRKL